MTTKLTLSIEAEMVDKAKRYALKHQTSVSKVFSELLDNAIKNDTVKEDDAFLEKIRKIPVSENIKALRGILKGKVPEDVNLWDAKYEYLKERYDL